MKIWQDSNEEPNDVTRRINQLVEVQQNRVEVNERLQRYKDNMKASFDRKDKDRDFIPGDLVPKWEAKKEDTGKHGKFDPIWSGPYKISAPERKNDFLL
jgi:hypothetical protein